MPKHKKERKRPPTVEALELSSRESTRATAPDGCDGPTDTKVSFIKGYRVHLGTTATLLLIVLGVFASNGWLPNTDSLTGERAGWFGTKLPRNAPEQLEPIRLAAA
jgi:hypothetical protein